ncbi:MAG: cysteine desulfurase [Crocinitomicaceae bacterium]|nr:cysteine desulfurase [Crocinitomicaceae bacterium]
MNIEKIRAEFPILKREINGKKLIYFDNGATTQKPRLVLDAINEFYTNKNANIHRGVHYLSQLATNEYEGARKNVQSYLNAKHLEEIIFTKGTTDGINLVASSFGETLKNGDEIIISAMEHHSNIVPWQLLCEKKNLVLRVVPIHHSGEMDMDAFEKMISSKTKLVAITHVSNTLGTINPIEQIIEKAHLLGAKVLVDGAQSLQHFQIDVQSLDCDFFVFSGHKVFGPTGIGVLYGKKEILEEMPPYQGGGDMIAKVSFEKTTFNDLPFKFEAGTPNISGVIGLGKAIEFIESIDKNNLSLHEQDLLEYAQEKLLLIEGLQIVGTAANKSSVISFVVDGVHPFDIGTLLDQYGIAVRTGHHCTQPLMDFYSIPGTIRASFSIYNTRDEIDLFIEALKKGLSMLR